jgi:hypothetical protein
MTIQALLPVTRWTRSRKAEVIWALSRGLITSAQACAAHGLTGDELASWVQRHSARGVEGLMATRARRRRARSRRRPASSLRDEGRT